MMHTIRSIILIMAASMIFGFFSGIGEHLARLTWGG
jgi:hypothetical protein